MGASKRCRVIRRDRRSAGFVVFEEEKVVAVIVVIVVDARNKPTCTRYERIAIRVVWPTRR